MSRVLTNSLLIAAATTLLVCPTVWAQLPDDVGSDDRPARISNMEFPGGTVGEYIDAIREAAPGANILPPITDVGGITIPPVKLDGVDVGAALELLDGDFPLDKRTVLKLDVDEDHTDDNRSVFRITASKDTIRVWNVIDLLSEKIKAEDVLTSVETAVELLADDYAEVQVKFHEATGLLIARGTPRQVETIDGVLGELRGHLVLQEMFGGLNSYPAPMAGNGKSLSELRAELQQLLQRIDQLESKNGKAGKAASKGDGASRH